MSNVGKTQLRGHGLRHEGNPRYNADGTMALHWWAEPNLRAKCDCGELSEPGISTYGARRWHRAHKDALRATNAPLTASKGAQDRTTEQGTEEAPRGAQGVGHE